MAASVRVEDEAFSDVRYDRLARAAGLADADHARGKMLKIWRQCTIEHSETLEGSDVVAVLGSEGVSALVDARLGEVLPDGKVRIRGTRGRIEWLDRLRTNGQYGHLGGRPRKTQMGSKINPEGLQTKTPPAPAPAPAPDLYPLKSPPTGGRSSSGSKSKPRSGATPDEEAAIAKVLARLSEAAKTAYRPTTVSHRNLILPLLRKGHSDFDLRLVIRLCEDLWQGNPEMEHNLRPSTVFRASRFDERLEQARARWKREGGREPPEPSSPQPAFDLGAAMRGGSR